MRHISATAAKRRLTALLDEVQREPIIIRRKNTGVAVMLSTAEYEGLRGFNVAEFQKFCDRVGRKAVERGLTEKDL